MGAKKSNKRDSLGDRMKNNYENVTRYHLTRRMPVIIRLDGKAFHTFTKGLKKPFDEILIKTMQDTMKYLCENIQGCVLGYTQSDEITLVLVDYTTLTSCAWFDNNLIKMCSVAASMATLAFNKAFRKHAEDRRVSWENMIELGMAHQTVEAREEYRKYLITLSQKYDTALFDARAFNIPKEEVTNCLIWRQQDAIRNSIGATGHAHFTPAELHKKSSAEIFRALLEYQGIEWNSFPTTYQRGCCCIKESYISGIVNEDTGTVSPTERTHWVIDENIPLFTEDREYIEKLI